MPTLLYGVERTMYFFNHFYPMGRPISVAIVTPCANEPMWPYTISFLIVFNLLIPMSWLPCMMNVVLPAATRCSKGPKLSCCVVLACALVIWVPHLYTPWQAVIMTPHSWWSVYVRKFGLQTVTLDHNECPVLHCFARFVVNCYLFCKFKDTLESSFCVKRCWRGINGHPWAPRWLTGS